MLSFGHSSAADPVGHGDWINGDNSYYFTFGGPGGGNESGVEIRTPYYDTSACKFWKAGGAGPEPADLLPSRLTSGTGIPWSRDPVPPAANPTTGPSPPGSFPA